MTEKNKIRYLHIFVVKKKKESRCVEVSPPFTTSESQSKDLHRPERNHARLRITTYNNDVRGWPVICADIPVHPLLKLHSPDWTSPTMRRMRMMVMMMLFQLFKKKKKKQCALQV